MWSAVYPGKVKIDVSKFQGICAWVVATSSQPPIFLPNQCDDVVGGRRLMVEQRVARDLVAVLGDVFRIMFSIILVLVLWSDATSLIGTLTFSIRTMDECRSAYIVASGSAPMALTICLTSR